MQSKEQPPKFKNLAEMKAAFIKAYVEYQKADEPTRAKLRAQQAFDQLPADEPKQ